MAHPDQEVSLLKLKCLRAQVDWTIEEQRDALLHQLMILFAEWSGPLPCLLEIFRPYEIDWLISEVITKKMKTIVHKNRIKGFIEFVASTGYKESLVDQHINASELRTTPIHQAQRHDIHCREDVTRELFKIYDRYDLNYTDEDGLTHFHVACRYGLVDACRNFLLLGHDPNCPAPEALDDRQRPFRGSLLHLALAHGHRRVVEWLLHAGADPTRTDARGSTCLHVACAQRDDADDTAEMLLASCGGIQHRLLIEARDASGRTALHLAADSGATHSFGTLLARGADPNALDSNGATALHAICRRGDGGMAELLFSICHQSHLQLDVRDREGKTALNYAVASGNVDLSHLLLASGADARVGMEHLPANVRRAMMQAALSVQCAGAYGLPFGWLN